MAGFILGTVLAALIATAHAADPAPGPLSIAEVERLLRSGVGEPVILTHLAAVGTSAAVTAADLVALRAAGASDGLLEAVLAMRSVDDARAYTRVGPDGRLVLHLTNLDSRGRRLGGEVPDAARVNVVQTAARQPEADSAVTRSPRPRRTARSLPAAQGPILAGSIPAGPPDEDPIDDPGLTETMVEEIEEQQHGEFPSLPLGTPVSSFVHPGLVHPGFVHPGVPWTGGFPAVHPGLFVPSVAPVSPPGSWSHYLKHHHNGASVRRIRRLSTR
jgi:hypothetical protein